MEQNNSMSDLAMNMPNTSLMFAAYTPTFGNINFQIIPSQSGEVSNTFGTISYLSLEAILYQQQMQAQTAPTAVLPGQNTGQQNVQGSYTVTDNAGNQRVIMGYSATAF